MSEPKDPFTREVLVDEPAFVGARWWQESLRSTVDRRAILKGILVAGAALAGLALVFKVGKVLTANQPVDYDGDDFYGDRQPALDMQKRFGWSFGATSIGLVFDGAIQTAFDRSAIDRLAADLTPTQARLVPFAIRTLFEAPAALPTATTTDGSAPPVSLRDALFPMHTTSMAAAYRAGRALAAMLAAVPVASTIVVDLPGEEAVAFAAGAAEQFEPVFLFDNWPHPYGVVPSHRPLAAALYYQPRFLRARGKRKPDAPALFVLDRARLTPYSDSPTLFDNRWIAKLPSAGKLAVLGAQKLFYVVPDDGALPELDDLNDDFVSFEAAFMAVRYVARASFADLPTAPPPEVNPLDPKQAALAVAPPKLDAQEPDDATDAGYLGSALGFTFFARHYDLPAPGASATVTVPAAPRVATYRLVNRVQAFALGQKPNDFSTVPVVIAVATGTVVASALGRSGSWNRAPASGSYGGG